MTPPGSTLSVINRGKMKCSKGTKTSRNVCNVMWIFVLVRLTHSWSPVGGGREGSWDWGRLLTRRCRWDLQWWRWRHHPPHSPWRRVTSSSWRLPLLQSQLWLFITSAIENVFPVIWFSWLWCSIFVISLYSTPSDREKRNSGNCLQMKWKKYCFYEMFFVFLLFLQRKSIS